jgi:hypothetical protein
MTDVLNNVDFEKLLKCYNNVKKNQKQYHQSEKGKIKVQEASRRYYNDRKDDPVFKEKLKERRRKARELKILNELNYNLKDDVKDDVKDEKTVEKIV